VKDQHAEKLEHASRTSRDGRRFHLASRAQLRWNLAKRAPYRRKQQERDVEQPEQRSRIATGPAAVPPRYTARGRSRRPSGEA
jgi:hypothetical protein